MIRLGLLGAARIAPEAVIRPAAKLPNAEITAVAASSTAKAQAFADEHGIPVVAANYAALVSSPEVDAVYNALPPCLHEKWSVAAVEAGKHVLCEKPFAMNAPQAGRMVDAARSAGRRLVEAFHYRFHPYMQRVLDLLAADTIGDVRRIEARFDARIPYRAGEFRHDPALGGGALMDLGCYPAHWVRTLLGSEPEVLDAECLCSDTGVDLATRAIMRTADGRNAELSTAMNTDTGRRHSASVEIKGDKGRMHLENPIAPHNGNRILIESDGTSRSESIEGETTYFYQLRHFAAVVDGTGSPLTGGDDAVNNMRLIDAIYEAAGFERPRDR